jgi:hypothetical protein
MYGHEVSMSLQTPAKFFAESPATVATVRRTNRHSRSIATT